MRWSKPISKKEVHQGVMTFQPTKFVAAPGAQAHEYIKQRERGSNFIMSSPLKIQTGVKNIEEKKVEEQVEERVLEEFRVVQEEAYEAGKELGRKEGRERAFEHFSREIEEGLAQLQNLFNALGKIKAELLEANEASMVRFTYELARQIVQREVQQQDDILLEVLRQAVSLSQEEESITAFVSESQLEFVEAQKNRIGREFDFLKKIKFVSGKDVTPGGCVVETNYGVIDSRIEQRTKQLYATLSENLPRVKDRVVR